MPNEFLDLTGRMERLERENRRLKRIGAAMCGVFALTGLVAMAAPTVCDVIYGERLVLRDQAGRQRLVMDAYRTDAPSITWHDKDGRAQAKLSLDSEGVAALEYLDDRGASKSSHRFAPGGSGKGDAQTGAPPIVQTN